MFISLIKTDAPIRICCVKFVLKVPSVREQVFVWVAWLEGGRGGMKDNEERIGKV